MQYILHYTLQRCLFWSGAMQRLRLMLFILNSIFCCLLPSSPPSFSPICGCCCCCCSSLSLSISPPQTAAPAESVRFRWVCVHVNNTGWLIVYKINKSQKKLYLSQVTTWEHSPPCFLYFSSSSFYLCTSCLRDDGGGTKIHAEVKASP